MQSEFVLGKWLTEDLPLVRAKVSTCVEVIENFAVMGLSATMTQYNNLRIIAG